MKLWEPIVAEKQVNPKFKSLRDGPHNHPARLMLDEIVEDFKDPEGNFLEQFQSAGFDARFFELYLYAYLLRSGFKITRDHSAPDFIVTRNDFNVAIEATTINPSTSGILHAKGNRIHDLSSVKLFEFINNELPIRFGSPLSSKLQKQYWNLPQCHNLPFVVAIEAFFDDESLFMSEAALTQYLFGVVHSAKFSKDGQLEINETPVKSHEIGSKQIPSGLFFLPGSEYLSAVIFTNSGTHAKFSRMGYQHGLGCEEFDIYRQGYCFNPEPEAMDPSLFLYFLRQPPFVESWGQGLMVIHNPNAIHPIPKDFFVDAAQQYKDEVIQTEYPGGWHPIASTTTIIKYADMAQKPNFSHLLMQKSVAAISKLDFQEITGFILDNNPICQELGWFADDTISFLGSVFQDHTDGDFGFTIFARDRQFNFKTIKILHSVPTRDKARMLLQLQIADLLDHPKRIF